MDYLFIINLLRQKQNKWREKMKKILTLLIIVFLLSSCAGSDGTNGGNQNSNSSIDYINLPTISWKPPIEYEDGGVLTINDINFFNMYITFEGNTLKYKYPIESISTFFSFNVDDEDMFIGGNNLYSFNMTTVANGVESTMSETVSAYVSFY